MWEEDTMIVILIPFRWEVIVEYKNIILLKFQWNTGWSNLEKYNSPNYIPISFVN